MDLSHYLCSNNNKNSTFYELLTVLNVQSDSNSRNCIFLIHKNYRKVDNIIFINFYKDTAFAKNDYTQKWYQFEDENVRQVDPKDFQALNFFF